jgi:hypothetical protein
VKSLLYVFCAAEGSVRALSPNGMPDGAPPRVVALDDTVSLVVSDVPAAIYEAAALEPKLSDLDWVSRAGAAHHAAIDALADQGHTVVPFRLFTLFSSEAAARATLSQKRQELARAFDRVRGRQEWVLRIGKPDPALSSQPAATTTASASGTGFLQAKAQAKRDAAARTVRVKEDAAAVVDALHGLAEASRRRPVESAGTLLVDTAFLVTPDGAHRLRDSLTHQAQRLLEEGCAVSLTGPWPPYSFAAIDTE